MANLCQGLCVVKPKGVNRSDIENRIGGQSRQQFSPQRSAIASTRHRSIAQT